MRVFKYILGLLLVLFGCLSCLDELEIEALGEGEQTTALVVEAVLTDEMITQKVYLSRSSLRLDLETDTVYNPYIPLGSRPIESVDMEVGATVRVVGDNGIEYQFTEGKEGVYLSNQQFALDIGSNYTLEVTTKNGLEYESAPVVVKGKSKLTNMYAEKRISNSGEEGIAIYVDSEQLEGETRFYKYAYEETYKIVAPYWQLYDFELTNYDNSVYPPEYNLEIVERQVQNQICYNTVSSNEIVLGSSLKEANGNVAKQMIRFISKENFIISHRYSILVQQQVQSAQAYSFYETLNSFSQSDNVFSQIQPGALYGNVRRKDGTSEEVLGYVEAVGVSNQRLFFNYEDFFSGEDLPPHVFGFDCNLQTAPLIKSPGCPQDLLERIDLGTITYFAPYDENLVPFASCPGPYVFVPRICGDCTLLGSNVKPEFWVD